MKPKYSSLFFLTLFFLTSCGYYAYQNRLVYPKLIDEKYEVLSEYEGVYILRFSGRDSARMKRLLKDSFKKEDYYEVLDEFPYERDLNKIALLEVDIEDVNFWEVNQLPKEGEQPVNIYNADLSLVPVVISNIRLRFRFKIRNGKSNKVILDEVVEQSFQQYYTGRRDIESRPDAETENDRLSRLTFDRFAAKLNFDTKEEYLYYELGVNENSYLEAVGFQGDILLKKGVRLAEGKNYNDALLAWVVAAYEPDMTDDFDDLRTYAVNRASALYNMGQVYRYLGRWGQASRMYALANQTQKKLHYAQAWSDAIQIWKTTKANEERQKTDTGEEVEKITTNNLIFFEEQNRLQTKKKLDERQLLNADTLWPFARLGDEEKENKDSSLIKK